MSARLGIVLIVLLAPVVEGHEGYHGPWPPDHHSAHVADVEWNPQQPLRGQALTVTAALTAPDAATEVLLKMCRVQSYSCYAPQEMAKAGNDSRFTASLPWDAAFFRHVTQVGLALVLKVGNATDEASPVLDWPERPAALPAEAGTYYFYTLPPEPRGVPTFGAIVSITLVGLAFGLGVRRR